MLKAVGRFWRESGQMRVIIGDKLMQYGIVGGEDVVSWVFEGESGGVAGAGGEWMAGQKWDLIRMGVDKVNGRVVGVRRKIVLLEAEEEERRGGRRAQQSTSAADEEGNGGVEGMEMDTTTDGDKSAALQAALQALNSLQTTQKAVLVACASHFVATLLPDSRDASATGLASLLAKGGWDGRADWDEDDWMCWSVWGWWREFCRLVSVSHFRLGTPPDVCPLTLNSLLDCLPCSTSTTCAHTPPRSTPSYSRHSLCRRTGRPRSGRSSSSRESGREFSR